LQSFIAYFKKIIAVLQTRFIIFYLLVASFFFFISLGAFGQNSTQTLPTPNPNSTLQTAKDSLKKILQDTTKQNPLQMAQKKLQRDIETTVKYQAKDSIRFNVTKKMIYMFGGSEVVYGKISLNAENIDLNWQSNEVKARSRFDTVKRQVIGKPVFTEQGVKYDIDAMTYNFKTRKGIITGIRTKQDEGFVVGSTVKKTPENSMYVKEGIYTTCDQPHPHFGIRSRKMKVIPEKVTVSGMFNLEIEGVPTPLGFLFGMFPQPNRRRSGLIFPQYGETQTNGFFLEGGGIYLNMSQYFDFLLTTEFHSRGRWGLRSTINYKKRYRYAGSLGIRFLQTLEEIEGKVDKSVSNDFNVTWSHTPQSKGTGRFTANANFGTNTSNRRMMLPGSNANAFLSSTMNSNVSYNKTLEGTPFSFGVSVAHSQNIITKIVNITPSANVSMNRIFPFKSQRNPNSKSLFRQVNISYTGSSQTNFTNLRPANPNVAGSKADTLSFAPSNFEQILSQAQYSVKHAIPLSTTTTIAKNFNWSLGANYNETWAFERYYIRNGNPTVRAGEASLGNSIFNQNGVVTDTVKGFGRFFDYSFNTNVVTRLYMTYFPKGRVEAIRHQIAPSIGFSYSPDMSGETFGFFQHIPDKTGTTYTKQSIFPTSAGTPRQGQNGSVNFAFNNIVEIKVKPNSDSVKNSKKITIIDDFSFSSSYNIFADSMNLTPLNLGLRTSLLKQVMINISGTLDPYAYQIFSNNTPIISTELGALTPQTATITAPVAYRSRHFAWEKGQGIGTLSNVNIALSTNLNRKAAKKEYKAKSPDQQAEVDFINRNRHLYVDFDIPWNLNINYNLSYSKRGYGAVTITQTMNFSGDVSLTKKWKVGFQSGWDLVASNFTFTQFNINRDLHCWQMAVTWIPFGPRTGFTFDLNVKSAILRDLKLSRRNNWYYR
jgi:hypothetical protein